MTLPIIVSLGGHLLYLAGSANVNNPDEGSCRHFFSINMSSCFQPVSQVNGISCPEVCAVEASDSSWKRRGLIL